MMTSSSYAAIDRYRIERLRIQPANGDQEDHGDIALGPVSDARAAILLEQLRALEGRTLVMHATGS
jgi:hypothetical protein